MATTTPMNVQASLDEEDHTFYLELHEADDITQLVLRVSFSADDLRDFVRGHADVIAWQYAPDRDLPARGVLEPNGAQYILRRDDDDAVLAAIDVDREHHGRFLTTSAAVPATVTFADIETAGVVECGDCESTGRNCRAHAQ